jgi:Flp pilus assembly protein TadD
MQSKDELLQQIDTLDKGKDYDAIIKLLPNDVLDANSSAQLYAWRAYGHKMLGDRDNQLLYADKAILADQDYDYAFWLMGDASIAKGDYKKAVESLSKAIVLKSDNADYYNDRGAAYYSNGDVKFATDDYEKTIALKGDHYLAQNNLGIIWYDQKKYPAAIEAFDKAIALNPTYANAYRNRGAAYFDTGEFEKAIADFTEAIKQDPTNFGYLDKDIRLANEKIEEKIKMLAIEALQADKDEMDMLKKGVIETVESIRAAAKSKVTNVVHYTKVFVADIYVKGSRKPNAAMPAAKMQYSNAIYMNDPMEGKVFFDYLADTDNSIEEAYRNGEKRNETSVYLGSFLPAADNTSDVNHEDELVMWRTYGKDENGKEAAGCSVVLNCDFFKRMIVKTEMPTTVELGSETHNVIATDITGDTGPELLNVVYIKQKKNVVNDKEKKITTALAQLKKLLQQLLALWKKNKKTNNTDFCNEIENTFFKELSKISYLFKTADYQFENEVRIITYMPRDSNLIKCRDMNEPGKPPKRFYVESDNDILPYIKKIYLGPKVDHHQQWSLYFDYEIRQRAKELNEMTPSPYKIEPAMIEIRKSESRFQ